MWYVHWFFKCLLFFYLFIILIFFFFLTDPCDEIQCPAAQICQLDETRNPICRCNVICSYDFKPVCASNGKTYINECTLRVEACKARKSLRILYLGECGSGRGKINSSIYIIV